MRRFLLLASLLLLLFPAQAQAIPDAPTIRGSFCGQPDGFWWTGTGGYTVYRSTFTDGNWTEWQGIDQPNSGPFYGAWYGNAATEAPRRYSVTASDPTGESDKAAPIVCGQSTTLYVDQNNPDCSNTGPGTQSVPFCKIAPAAAQTQPGTTVRVSAGTYAEQVNPRSGAPGDPVTFEAVPGDTVTVTGQTNAFWLNVVSWVTIKGFNVHDTTGNGIHAKQSSNVQLIGNTVSEAGEPVAGERARGMRLELTDSVVANNTAHHNTFYGIYLLSGARNTIVGNVAYSNAEQFERGASGIRLFETDQSTVASNVTHHNEDSGIEVITGSTDNLLVNNVSYDNGDHGIDLLGSTGQRIISNSVYRNVTAGINAEGTSTGTTLANNISVDNGINSPRTKGNIRVDSTSTSGTTIDYDLVDIPSGQVLFDWGGVFYSSLAFFRSATGQEAHGIDDDPRWVDKAGGDLHLQSGSPAIDSADSGASGQTATDADGNPRADDFTVSNTGAGPRHYDDRGAYEFQPPDNPPDAQLTVAPDSGPIDLQVTANASASSDLEGIVSYSFDFGDGSQVVGPQPEATATHTYTAPGTYTVTVTVTDTVDQSSTATATVAVRDDPPDASLVVDPSSGSVPLAVTADASASTDTDATPISSYSFDFGDGSQVVGPQPGATATHTYETSGTYTVTVTVTDTAGLSSTASRTVSAFPPGDAPPDARLTVSPDSGAIDLAVTADASASTDNDAIVSYSFDFGDGSQVVGPQPEATATHTYTAPGTYTVTVTVTDTADLSSTATSTVTVRDDPPSATLVLQPASGPVPLVVSADASGSTDTDATPIASYTFDFGDGSVVGPQSSPTATHTYAVAGNYTATVSVADTAENVGTATAQVIAKANFVSNPGFENNLTGWNTSGAGPGITLARIAGGHTGDWQAQLTNTSTSSSTCLLNDSPNWVTTTSTLPYTAELWVRGETPGALVNLRLREWVGTTLVGTETAQVSLTTSWQKLTVTYTPVSPGSSTLDYNAYVTLAAPGTCFYADDGAIYRP